MTRQFISKDPAKADGEGSPYQYVSGDPVGRVDPTGQYYVDPATGEKQYDREVQMNASGGTRAWGKKPFEYDSYAQWYIERRTRTTNVPGIGLVNLIRAGVQLAFPELAYRFEVYQSWRHSWSMKKGDHIDKAFIPNYQYRIGEVTYANNYNRESVRVTLSRLRSELGYSEGIEISR